MFPSQLFLFRSRFSAALFLVYFFLHDTPVAKFYSVFVVSTFLYSKSFSTLPHDEEEERFSSPAIVPAETASEYSSQPENLHLLPVMPGSAADLSDFQAKPETSTVEERLESTTYCRQPPAKQRIAPGFVKRVGIVTVPGARVKLPSVYSKLGSPFAYASFRGNVFVKPRVVSSKIQSFTSRKDRTCMVKR